jgi:hypothetical protein
MRLRWPMDPLSAHRYGLAWPQSAGWPVGKERWQREFYWNYAVKRRHSDAVRIRKWYNFGNMVRQLVNCVDYSVRNDIHLISAPLTSLFRSGRLGTIDLRLESITDSNMAFSGTFFYPQTLGLTWDAGTRAWILQELRALYEVPRGVVEEDLVIHLRSGDVFGDRPHAGYAPPPLAYFVSAVQRSGARSVRVVAQDLLHPYLRPLDSVLARLGIDLKVQSASVNTDLSVMSSAPRLCLSQGTMGLAAAWLSSAAEQVFVFEGTEVDELRDLGVDVHVASRLGPNYDDSWTASARQIQALARLDQGEPVTWQSS